MSIKAVCLLLLTVLHVAVSVHPSSPLSSTSSRLLAKRLFERKMAHTQLLDEPAFVSLSEQQQDAVDDLLAYILPTTEEWKQYLKEAKTKLEQYLPAPDTKIDPAPKDAQFIPGCKIPEASSMLSKGYNHVALNTQINAGYTELAKCFQSIVVGNTGTASTFSKNHPVWYVFAPYASRVVGRGEISIQAALKVIHGIHTRLSSLTTAGATWDYVTGKVKPSLKDDVALAVGLMVLSFDAGINAGNMKALADVQVIKQIVRKFIEAISPSTCPTFSCCTLTTPSDCMSALSAAAGNVLKVPTTLLNALAEGNRLIYGDIGVSGEEYLRWREKWSKEKATTSGGNVPPLKVINEFCLKFFPNAEVCSKLWEKIQTEVKASSSSGSTPNDFSWVPKHHHKALKAAAFALYEDAGSSPANERVVKTKVANNMLAWVEQSDAAVPAFTSVKPGEVDRTVAFTMMTPFINLKFRTTAWTYYDYCTVKRISIIGKNWGSFRTRWEPILHSFNQAYGNIGDLWPLPTSPYAMLP